MKTTILFILSLLFTTSAMAANDSVAVFHRPEKVTILINEEGEAARLQNMMNSFDLGVDLHVITADQRIMLTCGRRINVASCTFSFYHGPDVVINNDPRTLEARADLKDLGLTSLYDFDMNYESSMGDKFSFIVKDGKIQFSASKKVLNKN